MIELQDLSKTYGTRARSVHALRDLTLEIPTGVSAVVGPNGAGKTTLLGLILGFLRPSAGRVAIDGESPRRRVRRDGVAYLPERFRLPPEWPVRAALRGLAALEAPRAGLDARVDAALERLGLSDYRDRPIGTLSRGLNQRLGLAQALLADHDLVVLDEPTEGLDPLWRVRFREIVADLRQRGRTILLASHELPEVERLADRVILLRAGGLQEVVEIGRAAAGPLRYRLDLVADDDTLAAAFPGATRDGDVARVTVADHRELSDRLAALLNRGATVRAVIPDGAGLEERVRGASERVPPGGERVPPDPEGLTPGQEGSR